MSTWLIGAGSTVVALAAATAIARLLRRRAVPRLPLRLPVAAADQDELRALLTGRREVEAVELVRRRYRLQRDDARAVTGDVAAHPDYPPDWPALAASLDGDLRARVRDLVSARRRSAALRLVRLRFDLPLPDADRLVSAIEDAGRSDRVDDGADDERSRSTDDRA